MASRASSSSSLRSGYCPYRGLATILPRLKMLSSSSESRWAKGFLMRRLAASSQPGPSLSPDLTLSS